MNNVYITKIGKFLPNDPITNDQIENVLGMVGDKPSKARAVTLRSNKIKTRYYALKDGKTTHTNAQLAAAAVRNLFDDVFSLNDVELLTCGTTGPDQLLPSHASMVQGELGGNNPFEVASFSGACLTGTQALKYAYMSISSGDKKSAISTGSERPSIHMRGEKYREEYDNLKLINENPYIAFEKDFLRWMLSDGAGAFLLKNEPNKTGLSLKIEWITMGSYSNQYDVCMYNGSDKNGEEGFLGYADIPQDEWNKRSVFSLKQDVRLLGENITTLIADFLKRTVEKKSLDLKTVDWFLPHISSYFFYQKVYDSMTEIGLEIPLEKWFTNLESVGNVGSASPYVMLEELFYSDKIKKGQKILMMIPE
ncbi:MAG TPA: beta-ketoacyl-ACP synthase III, partial [Alphaproteobacteria bacterium]|nr:beta-ketoacyl-ACP synthase III [Alphaproteobacteria bacterium]